MLFSLHGHSPRPRFVYRYPRRHVNVSEWGLTYSSPILCHVLLPELQPGRKYFYRVGDPIYNVRRGKTGMRRGEAGMKRG